jgi:hypothetical protein
LSGNKALEALKLLSPYFRTERLIEKAKFAIEYQESRKNISMVERMTPEYKELQKEGYEKMKIMNKRGKVGIA